MSTNPMHPFRLQDLPVDILLIVIKYLELHDLFLLSQTSRAMRYFAKRNWRAELHCRSRQYSLNFLSNLASALPDRWVYGTCVCLHEVDPHDVPAANSAQCDDDMKSNWCGSYRLQTRHVQLALKYKRRGGVYEKALDMMLSPYKITYKHAKGGPYIKYKAASGILDGRFHFLESWELTAKDVLALNQGWHTPITFTLCQHMYILGRAMKDPCYNTGLYDWFLYGEYAERIPPRSPPGRRQIGECAFCCTSYSFLIIAPEHIGVQALHDYGSSSSPDGNLWEKRWPDRDYIEPMPHFFGFRIRTYPFHGLMDFQLGTLDDSSNVGHLDTYHMERFAEPTFGHPTYLSIAQQSVDPEVTRN